MTVLRTGPLEARLVSQRIASAVATTAALTAIPADRRADGQLCLAAAKLYRFDGSATNTGAGTLTPDAGDGRWIEVIAGGTDFKDSVRVASTTNLVGTRTGAVLLADANGAIAAMDGVTLVAGDRILMKDQTTGADRGIYVITALGDGSSKWSMTRAADFDTSAKVTAGCLIPVSEGTLGGNKTWQLTTNDAITLNTTALTFAAVGAAIGVADPEPVGAAASAGSSGNASDEDHVHADPLRAVAGTTIADSSVTIAIAQGLWRTLPAATLSTNRSTAITVAAAGTEMILTRLDLSAYTWTVTCAGAGTPTLFVFPGGAKGSIRIQSNGTNWELKEAGVDSVLATATLPGAISATTYGLLSRVKVATKTVAYGDITDAGTTHTIDFAAALPAGAVYLGAMADCTAIFDNAGDTAGVTFDLGIKTGDTDAFLDGASLNAVAKVYTPAGVGLVAGGVGVLGYVGGVTPSIIFTGDVNLDTLTKGSAVFRVYYFDMTDA